MNNVTVTNVAMTELMINLRSNFYITYFSRFLACPQTMETLMSDIAHPCGFPGQGNQPPPKSRDNP